MIWQTNKTEGASAFHAPKIFVPTIHLCEVAFILLTSLNIMSEIIIPIFHVKNACIHCALRINCFLPDND